jgi:hypothetical protein
VWDLQPVDLPLSFHVFSARGRRLCLQSPTSGELTTRHHRYKSLARVSSSPRHRLPRRRRPPEPPLTHPTSSRAGSCPSPHTNAQEDTVTRAHLTLALAPSMAATGAAPHRHPSRFPPSEGAVRAPVSPFCSDIAYLACSFGRLD